MEPSARPRVKICCVSSHEEARLAVRLGASALGLVAAMPSGPGVIGEALIAEIAAATPPPVATFLLTSLREPEAIAEQHARCLTTAIQVCDRPAEGCLATLKRLCPGAKLVQVVHVNGPEALEEARLAEAAGADALLLDSGQPDASAKSLGGTGRVHDWSLSARIREAAAIPTFLAGGLNPGNVAEAVRRAGPFGLDVCSGVREGGRLDEAKLRAFFSALEAREG